MQQIIQFKHAKVLSVWARQLIDKRHCSPTNITTNKLRFNCFKPDIWLAGFENRTFDWLDLKLLESIVQFCHACDWFSLSGYPDFSKHVVMFFTSIMLWCKTILDLTVTISCKNWGFDYNNKQWKKLMFSGIHMEACFWQF